MTFASKITGLGVSLMLALGLMAPLAAWADGDRIDAVIVLGQSGQTITIPEVEPDASSLLLELAVEPGTDAEGTAYALEDLAFTPSLANVRADDVTVDEGADTIKVVVSAGTGNLFAGADGAVRLGAISMKSADEGAEATVKVTRFETMAASYESTDYPVEGTQAVYRVNSVAPEGSGGNGGNGGDGNGSGGAGPNTPAGYNPNTQTSGSSNMTRTGDVVMYSVIGLAVVAGAAGAGLLVRSRKRAANAAKEEQ